MAADLPAITRALVGHYARVKRDLPWRRTRDPYAIWVSEIMLQQTRVQTVIPYWERWMTRFPTVHALADAPLDDVLAAWAGLGYYSRARNLWSGAKAIAERWDGVLPARAAELRAVPGIGPYTAGAIASIAYGERAPLVDGNVARVLARVFTLELPIKSTAGVRALWTHAGELMHGLAADVAPGDLNQAVMELGATLCTPTSPRCELCPIAVHCGAARARRQHELPVVTPRKRERDLPVLARTLVWIYERGWLVIVRRRPDGLFGGLWELPPDDVATQLGSAIDPTPVAHHDQTLSHRRLRVTVVRGAMPTQLVEPLDPGYDAISRVRLSEASRRGIAAATAAILTKYQDTPWSPTPPPSPSSPRATTRSSKASAGSGSTPRTRTSRTRRSARPRGSTS